MIRFCFSLFSKCGSHQLRGRPPAEQQRWNNFFFQIFFFRWNFFEIKFGFFLIDSRIFLKPAPDSLTEQLDFFFFSFFGLLCFSRFIAQHRFSFELFSFVGEWEELCQKGNLKASDCQFNIRKLLSLVIDRLNKRWISENVNFNFCKSFEFNLELFRLGK